MLVFVLTMPFPPLGISDHIFVSISTDFPSNSKGDAPFHCIVCDCSPAGWDGLHDHLREVPWEDIFKLSASAASEFCEWVKVGMVYIPIINIKSSLTHLHGFHLFSFVSTD